MEKAYAHRGGYLRYRKARLKDAKAVAKLVLEKINMATDTYPERNRQ